MKFAIELSVLVAILAVPMLAACDTHDPVVSTATAVEATDHMRISTLRSAIISSGFVRAEFLRRPFNEKKRDAGELIFASPLMSINSNISCRDCHQDVFGSTDGLPNAVGAGSSGIGPERMKASDGRILPRNALAFWGVGSKGFDTFFWDGRVSKVGEDVISQFGSRPPALDPMIVAVHLPSVELREMVSDSPTVRDNLVVESVDAARSIQNDIARKFSSDGTIGPLLQSAYRKNTVDIAFLDVAESLAEFIRDEFRIRRTRLESFALDAGTITEQELAGGIIFYGRGRCASCHNGPYFSDFSFHSIAFPQAGFGKNGFGIDEGRYNVTHNPDDRFLFRTPPLFNVAKTAPYSHSGSVYRLSDAITAHFDPLRLIDTKRMNARARADIFVRLGKAAQEPLPSSLTDSEVEALVAFLEMLSFEKD